MKPSDSLQYRTVLEPLSIASFHSSCLASLATLIGGLEVFGSATRSLGANETVISLTLTSATK
jgi:hypothetical protein